MTDSKRKDVLRGRSLSVPELVVEIQELREGLREAAISLETIARSAGREEYLDGMDQVRGFAHNRAGAVRTLLPDNGEDE